MTHVKKVTALSVSEETLKACTGRPSLQRQAFVGSQKEILTLRYIAMKLGVEIKMCQTI
jgi:DNA-directed RNA polymerase specialized sigma24 family protein